MQLSDRVWNLSKQYKQELEESISVAIEPGISAVELAAKIKPYLNEPNKRFRRIRDKFGVLQLSDNAVAYHPGRGVYRSSARNAQRLARTEINMAYRHAEQLRWSQIDFVVGYEVKLTQNGKHVPDICDELVGKYTKEFKFSGWHPHCLCYTIPILKTEDEFLSLDDTKPSVNAVTDTPANFKQWVRDNKERIEAAIERGKLPYFLRDNMDAWREVVYPEKYKNKPADNEFKLLPLPLIAKDATESDIANLISILGHNNHWFDHLDNKVLFEISDKTNRAAGANRETATITIENTRFPTLRNALHNLTSGYKLSEGEAENIATLWHEMNHMRHIGIESAGKNITRRAMELANEWYTRQTLPDFYSAFGLDKVPYPKFMNTRPSNLYDGMVRRFDAVIKNMGLDKQSVFSVLENGLFNRDYSTQLDVLKDALIAGGLKSTDKFYPIEKLINSTIISSVDAPLSLKTVRREVLDKMGFVTEFKHRYGAAMKLGRAATKEAMKVIEDIGAPVLSKEQKQNIYELADALGIPRKDVKPMSFIDADHGISNPTKDKDNCQSVVVSFVARRRGLDCVALPFNEKNLSQKELMEHFQNAFLKKDQKGNFNPVKPTIIKGQTDEEIIDKVRKQLTVDGEYVLGINNKPIPGQSEGDGHVVNIIIKDGELIIHDEQQNKNSERFLKLESLQNLENIEIIKIDKAVFDINIVKNILSIK